MDDLIYIVTLGFSGSDIYRALIIAFFAAMLVAKKRGARNMTFVALLVDRFVWPLTAMVSNGADFAMLSQTFRGMMVTLPDDAGLFLVRYAGLFVMISVFAHLRRRLHAPLQPKVRMQTA